MKKMLALFIVLAMAASVSAVTVTYDITVNDQPYTGQDVQGSDIIHVQWMAAPEDLMGGFGAIVIDIDHGDYVANSFSQQAGFIMSTMGVVSPVGDGFQVTGGNTGFNLAPDQVNGVIAWDFHVPMDLEPSTLITIAPIAGTFNLVPAAQLPSVTLHVIPEPMTIALLGLGGLFLRRRK
jgi:hypothetical protein